MFKKILRWSLRVFLGLAAFWTLVHLVEDWRGKRAWESWKREQEAKGAIFDPLALVGPAIPDGDNFAKAPVIQGLLLAPGSRLFPEGFSLMPPKEVGLNWRTGHWMELKPWEEANHTDDLSAFLAPTAPRLQELNEASLRPGSRFDAPRDEGDAHGGLLLFRSAVRVLNLRVLFALRNGRPEVALQDVLTELRLGRQLSHDPVLTVQFVQAAMTGIAMQGIWEGLEAHAWNDAQLTLLMEELGRQDELMPFLTWGKDERIGSNRYWMTIAESPWWNRGDSIGVNLGSVVGHAIVPQGWLYRNMLAADEHLVETWLLSVDLSAHRLYQDKAMEVGSWWEHRRSTPYTLLAKKLSLVDGDMMASQAQRFAERQVALDEAFIVCALERHRLAHHVYPERLEALVPAYAAKLPCDIFSGAPLRYARTTGGFLLYSVGWNGKDEGGAMSLDGKDRDLMKGDWPWPHAAAH